MKRALFNGVNASVHTSLWVTDGTAAGIPNNSYTIADQLLTLPA
jgi:hypothetical protein